jgi:Transglutaminase-like superfamily
MARRLRRFRSLPPEERRLLLSAWLAVAAVRLGLWIVPFRSVRSSLDRWSRRRARTDSVGVDRIGRLVSVAAEFVPGATCLVQSLAAQALMVRHGHPAQVRIGVATGDRFAAHAWVESDGRLVFGHFDPLRYHPLPSWTEPAQSAP